MRKAFVAFAGLVAIGAVGSYCWFELRSPWERRYCEAMIGLAMQDVPSYRLTSAYGDGREWRIQFATADHQGREETRRASCLFSASEWNGRRMYPLLTLFLID